MARLWLLLLASLLAAAGSVAGGIGFEFHHRFSDRVRQWAEARAVPGARWPQKGTAEYYAALAHHDRALRGRSLADASASELAFADGNATYLLSSLGFLHYAFVELGTPNVTFLVALDTGSDLFWVPCDCQQCSSTQLEGIELKAYSPGNSSTSQKVPCSNSLCDNPNACAGTNSSCPYTVQYLSANTSSSGFLVEDVLHLTTEDATPRIVEAPIVFGCGDRQSGAFLDGAAPNGLFGLGMEKVAVPSILSSTGFTSNSFSMCFGEDGVGRINFGDKGSSDQQETAFFVDDGRHPSYRINMTGIVVGNSSTDMVFDAIVDSGTSFTSLADPMYTYIAENFNAQIKEKRYQSESNSTFEYCYELSPKQSAVLVPMINLTTLGGSVFPVNDPIIFLRGPANQTIYCLALLKFSGVNIIGQNFLTGLRVVFDRERLVLGWKNFDCYTVDNPAALSAPSSSPSAPDTRSHTKEMTTTGPNAAQAPAMGPPSYSPHSKTMSSLSPVLLMLSLALLW